jgi:hypothetical protein
MALLVLGSNRLCSQSSTSLYREHLPGTTKSAAGRTRYSRHPQKYTEESPRTELENLLNISSGVALLLFSLFSPNFLMLYTTLFLGFSFLCLFLCVYFHFFLFSCLYAKCKHAFFFPFIYLFLFCFIHRSFLFLPFIIYIYASFLFLSIPCFLPLLSFIPHFLYFLSFPYIDNNVKVST